jgi:NAD(P)-dependent dehydrogenase (short-subunit alcohol dehydrogenase family)
MLDISLTGLWKTVGVAATPMINARNGGSIVIISSIARLTGSEQFNGLWTRNASRLRKPNRCKRSELPAVNVFRGDDQDVDCGAQRQQLSVAVVNAS